MNPGQELQRVLEDASQRLGVAFTDGLDDVREYAANRMSHLALMDPTGPGYMEAVIAERDNVALRAAGRAVDAADATDREILGLIAGVLTVGAAALRPA